MKGFGVIDNFYEVESKSLIKGVINKANIFQVNPYTEITINGHICGCFNITDGFQNIKIKNACKRALSLYGYVVSKKYNINYNSYFYHSCLIRALDFLTIANGCDMRLSEIVIADASNKECINAFRLILPFARRIILVTEDKEKIQSEVDYAMYKYGTSVAVLNDPIKASEKADVVILSSNNLDHKTIANLNRPMLYFKFPEAIKGDMWFNNIQITHNNNAIDTIFAQGYVETLNKNALWNYAEKDGFNISTIKRNDIKILERYI